MANWILIHRGDQVVGKLRRTPAGYHPYVRVGGGFPARFREIACDPTETREAAEEIIEEVLAK